MRILGGLFLVGLVACSSSDDSSASAPPSSTTTSSSGSPAVTNDPEEGSGGPTNGEGGGTTTAAGWSTCSTSDALPAAVDRTRLAVTSDGSSTALYVAIDAEQFEGTPAIRRYTLQGSSGCTLARDMAFGTAGELKKQLGPSLEADSKGGLWTLSDPSITRTHPTSLNCSLTGSISSKFAHRFSLDAAGANGYVQLEGNPEPLGKLTAGASCTIAPLTLSGGPDGYRVAVADLAIDPTGRLHVSWGMGGPSGVEVYDATGAFVKSYVPDAAHPIVRQIAPCGTGICVLDSDGDERSLSRCDGDGASCVTHATPFAKTDSVLLATSPGPRSFFLRVAGTKADIVAGP